MPNTPLNEQPNGADTGVRTDRASVESRANVHDALGNIGTAALLRTLLAERDAAITRAESAESVSLVNRKTLEAVETQLAESQSQADALRDQVTALREAIAEIRDSTHRDALTLRAMADRALDIRARTGTDAGNGGLKPKEGV